MEVAQACPAVLADEDHVDSPPHLAAAGAPWWGAPRFYRHHSWRKACGDVRSLYRAHEHLAVLEDAVEAIPPPAAQLNRPSPYRRGSQPPRAQVSQFGFGQGGNRLRIRTPGCS